MNYKIRPILKYVYCHIGYTVSLLHISLLSFSVITLNAYIRPFFQYNFLSFPQVWSLQYVNQLSQFTYKQRETH